MFDVNLSHVSVCLNENDYETPSEEKEYSDAESN